MNDTGLSLELRDAHLPDEEAKRAKSEIEAVLTTDLTPVGQSCRRFKPWQ